MREQLAELRLRQRRAERLERLLGVGGEERRPGALRDREDVDEVPERLAVAARDRRRARGEAGVERLLEHEEVRLLAPRLGDDRRRERMVPREEQRRDGGRRRLVRQFLERLLGERWASGSVPRGAPPVPRRPPRRAARRGSSDGPRRRTPARCRSARSPHQRAIVASRAAAVRRAASSSDSALTPRRSTRGPSAAPRALQRGARASRSRRCARDRGAPAHRSGGCSALSPARSRPTRRRSRGSFQ